MNCAMEYLESFIYKSNDENVSSESTYPEIIYWSACLSLLSLNLIIAFAAQLLFRKLFPAEFLGISLTNLAWIFPLLVIIHFVLKILIKLRTRNPA